MPIFQPTDVTGCFGWYKASSIGWGSVTGYVTYWPDDSGSGNYLDLVKAGSGILRAPVYFTNVINGLPAVYFNGNNRIDSKKSVAFTARNAGLSTVASGFTGFCVFSPNDVINAQVIYGYNNDLQDTGDKNSFIIGIGGNGAGDLFTTPNQSGWFFGWGKDSGFGSWRNIISSGIKQSNNQWILRTDRFNPSTRQFNFDFNGATYSTGVASTSYNNVNYLTFGIDDEVAINFSRYYKGYIAEVIIYNRMLNDTEVGDIETYLKNKYAIDGTSSIPLFMVGADSPTGSIYNNRPLYTYNSPNTTSGINLYTVSTTGFTDNISLYIGSSQTVSSGWKLYIGASSTISSGTNLYIRGFQTQPSNIYLYTSASTVYDTGRTLYIRGLDQYGSGLNLYTSSAALYSGLTTLYTSAGVQTLSNSLYIYGKDSVSGYIPLYTANSVIVESGRSLFINGTYAYETKSSPLYIGSSESYSSGLLLYIGSTTPIHSSAVLYIGSALSGSKSSNLYIPGSVETNRFGLYVYGKESASGYIGLYTGAATSFNASVNSYVAGRSVGSGAMNLFIKQKPLPTGTNFIPLYISTPTTIGASGLYNTLPIYTYAIGNYSLMPLYLKNSENSPNSSSYMPMYLKTTELVNPSYNNITAFIMNNTAITGRKMKMYIRGDGVMDGASIFHDNMNLFLKQKNGSSQIVNLYMLSNTTGSLSSQLFTKGVYTYNSGTTLIISGRGTSGTTPLYIYAGGSYNSGLSLYMYSKPSIASDTNLYTYGF